MEMRNGSTKTGQLHIQPTSRWNGSTIDSQIVWVAGGANQSGLRINPMWTPIPDFYVYGFLKDNVYENNLQSIDEIKVSIRWFVLYRKKSASEWLTASLNEFKCIISAIAAIWNTSCKNASFQQRFFF